MQQRPVRFEVYDKSDWMQQTGHFNSIKKKQPRSGSCSYYFLLPIQLLCHLFSWHLHCYFRLHSNNTAHTTITYMWKVIRPLQQQGQHVTKNKDTQCCPAGLTCLVLGLLVWRMWSMLSLSAVKRKVWTHCCHWKGRMTGWPHMFATWRMLGELFKSSSMWGGDFTDYWC